MNRYSEDAVPWAAQPGVARQRKWTPRMAATAGLIIGLIAGLLLGAALAWQLMSNHHDHSAVSPLAASIDLMPRDTQQPPLLERLNP